MEGAISEDAEIASSVPSRRKIILDKDGKPCRACNSKLAFSAAMKNKPRASESESKADTAANVLNGQDEPAARTCPPDGETLGQNTWSFLHSAAAYYPNKPSEAQQSAMLSLIRALPHVYPCHTCAQALHEELDREQKTKKSWQEGAPLQEAVRSGKGFRMWLCGLHNEVNARLGKPTWPCTEDLLQQRWKDGPSDGRCD
jgi:cytochrome c oxidase assembly protein subunit 16